MFGPFKVDKDITDRIQSIYKAVRDYSQEKKPGTLKDDIIYGRITEYTMEDLLKA